jgi:hypothetical protein
MADISWGTQPPHAHPCPTSRPLQILHRLPRPPPPQPPSTRCCHACLLRPTIVVCPWPTIRPRPPTRLQPTSSARGYPSVLSRPRASSRRRPPAAAGPSSAPRVPPVDGHQSLTSPPARPSFTLRPPTSLCSKSPPMKTQAPRRPATAEVRLKSDSY